MSDILVTAEKAVFIIFWVAKCAWNEV